jgi:nucleotide-binding universal stress UspA family protein
MLPIQTILHPTDFSERANYAFKLACSLARDHGARVVVLHVATPPPVVAYGEMVTEMHPEDYYERLRDELDKYVKNSADLQVEVRLAEGDPAKEAVRVAKEIGSDLIVMGSHGKRALTRLLLGSVAEFVLRHARCPVLVLPHRRQQEGKLKEPYVVQSLPSGVI